jgi:hypothetical protein
LLTRALDWGTSHLFTHVLWEEVTPQGAGQGSRPAEQSAMTRRDCHLRVSSVLLKDDDDVPSLYLVSVGLTLNKGRCLSERMGSAELWAW